MYVRQPTIAPGVSCADGARSFCMQLLEHHGVRRVLVHDSSIASPSDPMAAYVGIVSDTDLFRCERGHRIEDGNFMSAMRCEWLVLVGWLHASELSS